MKVQSIQFSSLCLARLKNLTKLATSLSLATGLLSLGLPIQSAFSTEISQARPAQAKSVQTTAPSALPNGVYLYGQSTQPDRVGQAYFVFEVRQGKALGALYMPRSSFDCAYGTFQPDRLALTVVDSYERQEHPYAIALQRSAAVASRGNPAMTQINLEGFQRLANLSDTDRRILNVCKANYQQRVWK
jgi:hypothetical protein